MSKLCIVVNCTCGQALDTWSGSCCIRCGKSLAPSSQRARSRTSADGQRRASADSAAAPR